MTKTEFKAIVRSLTKTSRGCKEWPNVKTSKGYGVVHIGHRNRMAHRVSHEVFNGPLVNGLVICHRCDNPSCVNPDHLFQGTQKENIQDMIQKGRCRNQHTFKKAGTVRIITGDNNEPPTTIIRRFQGVKIEITFVSNNGWLGRIGSQNVLNPYTKTFFSQPKSCWRVCRFYLRHNKFPGIKRGEFTIRGIAKQRVS